MKRHPALVPLSHDHHHALVEARRLARAAGAGDEERRVAVAEFLRFFSAETIAHFRDEEERLFPLLVDRDGAGVDLLVQALLEHQRIHALVARLEREASATTMRELAELLEAHVRLEERELFPVIERAVDERALESLELEPRDSTTSHAADLLGPRGIGPLWGTETEDLNATLLAWPAAGGPDEHVNNERDVVLVILEGWAAVTIDGEPRTVRAGEMLIVEKGRRRSIAAGPAGVRYVSIHRRRGPLQIAPLRSAVGQLRAEPDDEQ